MTSTAWLMLVMGVMCGILTGMDVWLVFINKRINMALEEPTWKSNI
jgi:hypothetical protein